MERVVILGGGESGVGSAILAKKQNYDVFLSDKGKIQEKYKQLLEQYEIDYEEGKHTEDLIFNANLIVKSPGVPKKAELILKLREKGISIISEIEFASRFTDAKIIAITGSNGKTTTTSLVYHILKQAGLNVGLGGNIGTSFALLVATQKFDYYVLEISSFQLDDIVTFKPYISIILNITPDHLDEYDYSFDNYANAKLKITQNQDESDYFIFNDDDAKTSEVLNNLKVTAIQNQFSMKNVKQKSYADDESFFINDVDGGLKMQTKELSLIGKHNIYNSLAAATAANLLKIKKEVIKRSLTDFKSVQHRLEPVLTIRGVHFINDSKATNVNATYYALEGVNTPIVWIAGGKEKGNDYSELLPFVKTKVKAIVCLGADNKKIIDFFSPYVDVIIDTHNVEDCVKEAYKLADSGDTVLLSPACKSFDLFNSYEDRGDQFKAEVRKL